MISPASGFDISLNKIAANLKSGSGAISVVVSPVERGYCALPVGAINIMYCAVMAEPW